MTITALFIDKGTIIHATRDFKSLSFKEILEQHEVINAERYIPPDPNVGGWGKFIKNNINNPKIKTNNQLKFIEKKKRKNSSQRQQVADGWLHI